MLIGHGGLIGASGVAAAGGDGSVGSSSTADYSNCSANELALGAYTASAGGTAQYLHFYVQYVDFSAPKRLGVWNSAGSLLAEYAIAAWGMDTGAAAWRVVTLASPLTLTAGQTYILGFCTDDSVWRIYSDGGSVTTRSSYPPTTAFGSIDPASITGSAAMVLDNDSNATPS